MRQQKANWTPIFPPIFQKFFENAARVFAGMTFLTLGAALMAAVMTYSPNDPSWNTASDGSVINNALGIPGAYTADVLIQSVGLASIFVIFTFWEWGLRLLIFQPMRWMVWRILALPPMMALLAAFLAVLPVPPSWPLDHSLGGFFGTLSLNALAALTFFQTESLRWVMAGASLAAGIGLFFFVSATSRKEMKIMGQIVLWVVVRVSLFIRSTVRMVMRTAYAMLRAAYRFVRVKVFKKDVPRLRAAKPARRQARGKPDVTAPVPADAPKQVSLNFGSSKHFNLPSTGFLQAVPLDAAGEILSQEQLEKNARQLESVLNDFGVQGEIINVRPGPVVTLYELEPAPGIKSSRVIGLADDIARSMSAVSARVAVVAGKNVIGIELPNAKRETVYLRELLESKDFAKSSTALPLVLGKDIGGGPVIVDLATMPHLLIAGTTGSGKSVAINTMILSLLYTLSPDELRLIMIDPKMLELSVYEGIPHLLTPVVTEPKKAVTALKWCVREMENRYRSMAKIGVRNIDGFNQRLREAEAKGETLKRRVQTGYDDQTGKPVYEEEILELKELPYIVVVVDEMADLMLVAGKDIEAGVQRLAQMARAAGIHILMATQRPSVDVITGTIKANFPTRVSFQVTSKIDSRTILGEQGAEQLLGRGDMLYMAGGGRITRVHGPYVSDEDVEKVVQHLRKQGAPTYLESVTVDDEETDPDMFAGGSGDGESDDSLYDQAVAIVVRDKKPSISYIQRRLKIGYNKAASIMERMEDEGIVSSASGSGKREVLTPNEDDKLYG